MYDFFEIEVECHSGFKSDEYPVCFFWDNIRFEITDIGDRWYQRDTDPNFRPANYFKVRTDDDKTYILKKDIESGKWYLWIRGESLNL